MKSVFVTGGTGYIGREFSRQAREAGWEVRVLTRSDKNNDGLRAKGFSPVVGDLAQPGAWQAVAAGSDAIVHLAQPETFGAKITRARAEAYRASRLTMDALLLGSLSSANRVVYVGGTSYYGDQGVELRDERATPNPKGWGPYVAPAIEKLPEYRERGLNIVEAFPAWVYGPASWFVEYQIEPIASGKPVYGLRGRARYASPVHVSDCAGALLFLLDKGIAGERYFIVDDKPSPTSDMVVLTGHALGRTPKLRQIPRFAAEFVLGPVVTESLTCDVRLSNAKLKALGFHLQFPSMVEGIPNAVASWRVGRKA